MKNLILILLVFITLIKLNAQQNTGISAGVIYSGYQGLHPEISLTRSINKNLNFNFRAATNFKNSYSLRTGINYMFLQNKKINPTIGVEYNYTSIFLSSSPFYPISRYQKLKSIEFPIGLNVKLNNSFNIFGTLAPSIILNSKNIVILDYFIDNIRLGVQYKFKL